MTDLHDLWLQIRQDLERARRRLEEPWTPEDGLDPAPPEHETLLEIREDLGDCQRCRLHVHRRNLVFGEGDPEADLLIVGEAPGEHEDVEGRPFVGPAGDMLGRILRKVLQIPRDRIYILNVCKCRPTRSFDHKSAPPGARIQENRPPMKDEIEACLPFLKRQIRSIRPKIVLILGTTAWRALIDPEEAITSARGTWRRIEGIPTMGTFHPSHLVRKIREHGSERRPEVVHEMTQIASDFMAVKKEYQVLGGKGFEPETTWIPTIYEGEEMEERLDPNLQDREREWGFIEGGDEDEE